MPRDPRRALERRRAEIEAAHDRQRLAATRPPTGAQLGYLESLLRQVDPDRFLTELLHKASSGIAADPPESTEDPMKAARRLNKPSAIRLITELKLHG